MEAHSAIEGAVGGARQVQDAAERIGRQRHGLVGGLAQAHIGDGGRVQQRLHSVHHPRCVAGQPHYKELEQAAWVMLHTQYQTVSLAAYPSTNEQRNSSLPKQVPCIQRFDAALTNSAKPADETFKQ